MSLDSGPDHPTYDSHDVLQMVFAVALRSYATFESNRHLRHIDSAIKISRQVLLFVPEKSAEEAFYLDKLGAFLETRFTAVGETRDIEEGLSISRQAVASALSSGYGDLPGVLSRLGNKLILRFDRFRNEEDLSEAAAASLQAVEFTQDDDPRMAANLANLVPILMRQFQTSDKLETLDVATHVAARSVDLTPESDPVRAARLSNLATVLSSRYERLSEIAALHESISCAEQAVNLSSSRDMHYPIYLTTLSGALDERYQSLGNLVDLEKSVSMSKQAINLLPDGHAGLPIYLHNLAVKLGRLYERVEKIEHLQEAISNVRRALSLTPHDNPLRAVWLKELGTMLGSYYQRVEKLPYLNEAISIAKEVMEATPDAHFSNATRLTFLGHLLLVRYDRYKDLSDLQEAIILSRLALDTTPLEHNTRARALDRLSISLVMRYDRTRQLSDLQEAISLSRDCVQLASGNAIEDAKLLHHLGTQLARRYEHLFQEEDIKEAVTITHQAVGLLPTDHSTRSKWLDDISDMIDSWSEHEPDSADRRAAFSMVKENGYSVLDNGDDLLDEFGITAKALKSTSPDDPSRGKNLAIVATKHERRYEHLNQLSDLEAAISLLRQALAMNTETSYHDLELVERLSNCLGTRYDRISKVDNLDEAISLSRTLIKLLPADESGRRDVAADKLASRLLSRYVHAGELTHLEEAIVMTRGAIDTMPADSADKPRRVDSLSDMLQHRFERLRVTTDIDKAVTLSRENVNSTTDDSPHMAVILNNHTSRLFYRFQQFPSSTDLDEAIGSLRRGMPLTHDDELLAKMLNNFGSLLYCRYLEREDVDDLHEGIAASSQALDLLPGDHQQRIAFLNAIAKMHMMLFTTDFSVDNLRTATAYLMEAWCNPISVPLLRIQIGSECLRLLAVQEMFDEAISVGMGIIDMLPDVSSRHLERNDKEFVLSTFSGVAATLCSVLLRLQRTEEAMQYLERGRAVIIGQLIDGRGDLSQLEEQYPTMARLYRHRQEEANKPVPEESDPASRRALHDQRSQAMIKLENCIHDIRGLPDQERFLQGLSTAEMQRCAEGGFIVVVNISTWQSDAIIISPATLKVLNLAQLVPSEVEKWLRRDWKGRRSERAKNNKDYLRYLAWLWDTCVKDVLDEIEHVTNSSDNGGSNGPAKIWWVGSGLASQIPFHAAGRYGNKTSANALRRAVSSYTPSIKALFHARQQAAIAKASRGPLIIATMPTTPGDEHPDLPGVEHEVQRMETAVGSGSTLRHLDRPSAVEVIEALPSCSVAHFACHGFTRRRDPSKSGLVLQSDGAQDHLTVQRISELDLRGARLAYLSACSTAENNAARLEDEVIHLVSGFQVAGFPHAVGCLWPSNDRVCAEVANSFYQQLFKESDGVWKDEDVAAALRIAVHGVDVANALLPKSDRLAYYRSPFMAPKSKSQFIFTTRFSPMRRKMRFSIVPSQLLLPHDAVKLGRFITSVTHPHLHHHDPPSLSPPPVLTSTCTSYTGTHEASDTARFRSALTSVLAARFSKVTRLSVRVTTETYTASLLDNSDAWFDEATQLVPTRAWLERAIDRGDDVFLVVGLHSVADAQIAQESVARAGATGRAEVPLTLTLEAAGAVAPLGGIVAGDDGGPGVGFDRQTTDGATAQFVAPGERICAIEYRKVKVAWLSSSKVDAARLGKMRQWPSMERTRDEEDGEDDVIEVGFEDGFEEELELEGEWERNVVEDDIVILIPSYERS